MILVVWNKLRKPPFCEISISCHVLVFLHLLIVECNGLTTYLKSSQNGSFYVYMDSYGSVNRSCSWLITAPIGQRVLIYFTSFRLAYRYRYDCDSVTITDGKYTWSPRLAKYCGRDLPRPVYSSGRQILITFQPSYDVYEYFTLHYSTLSYPSSGMFSKVFWIIYSILSWILKPWDCVFLIVKF